MDILVSTSAYRHVRRSGGSCYVWLDEFSGAFSALKASTRHPAGAIEFRTEKAWHPGRPFADDGIDLHLDTGLDVPFLSIGLRLLPRRSLSVAWSLERPKARDFLASLY